MCAETAAGLKTIRNQKVLGLLEGMQYYSDAGRMGVQLYFGEAKPPSALVFLWVILNLPACFPTSAFS